MSNTSSTILYGHVNSRDTSTLYVFYSAGNYPTPWPFVLLSCLVSFGIACVGFKLALIVWNENDEAAVLVKESAPRENWMTRLRNNKQATKGENSPPSDASSQEMALMGEIEPPDEHHEIYQPTARIPSRAFNITTRQMVVVVICIVYSTARCVTALVLSLNFLITQNGTRSAPSSLWLLLISIQAFAPNRSIPRIMNLILVLDLAIVQAVFFISAYGPTGKYYGQLDVFGGNCPVYADSCDSQSRQWSIVGCGSVVPALPNLGSRTACGNGNPNCDIDSYPPFASGTSGAGLKNILYRMEMAIAFAGSLWSLTIVLTIYKAHHLFTGSLSDLLRPMGGVGKEGGLFNPISKEELPVKRATTTRTWMVNFITVGISAMIIISILALSGHMAGELKSYNLQYMDSFGPPANTNESFTADGSWFMNNYANGSWTDCFLAATPTNPGGFWDSWFERNVESWYRLAAAL